MWTSTLDLRPGRILLTRLLASVWPGAYFSSLAPLRVENLPRQPLPAPGWVRVRNRLAGICGSDLHLIYADGDLRVAPAALPRSRTLYPGHEVVGEVIEIGNDVQHLHVGDRVVLQHGLNCVSAGVHPPCHSCASGNYNLCEHGTLPGPHPFGGGWSEEMLLHEQQLFPVPATLSDEQAVMLEPTAVAVHAVLRRLPQPGERILIIGAGTIGLLTLAVIHALVPDAEVSVLARHPFQIEQATRLGAARIIYPQDSYTGIQRATQAQLYQGSFGNKMLLGGFDGIYDTIGSSKTLHSALRWARANATVVIVGLSLHMMRLDLTPIWYQEVDLLGSMSHGTEHWPPNAQERRSSFDLAAELIERHQVPSAHLITHRFALTNYQNALLTAVGKAHSRSIKVVFDYSLLPTTVVPNVRASSRQRRPAANTHPLPPAPPPQEAITQTSNSIDTSATPLPPTPLPSLTRDTKKVAHKEMLEDTAKSPALKKQARVTPRLPLSQEQAPIQTEPAIAPPGETEAAPITIPIITTVPAVPVADPSLLTLATESVAANEPTGTVTTNATITQSATLPTDETAPEPAETATAQPVIPPPDEMAADEMVQEPAETSLQAADALTPAELDTTNVIATIEPATDPSQISETADSLPETTRETSQFETADSLLSGDSTDTTEKENGEDAATNDVSDSFLTTEGVPTTRKSARPRRRKKNSVGK